MDSVKALVREMPWISLDEELVEFEHSVQQHETLLKTYGVYEKLQRYIVNTPARLQNRLAEELRAKKKIPAESGLKRLGKARKREVLAQVQEQINYYLGVAQRQARRRTLIADQERAMGTSLISTAEAAEVLNTTTTLARAKLRRHLEKGEIRGFCYTEEDRSEVTRFWYWDKSGVRQLAKGRKR
jgi:hypothetical protein